jgi:hypothetical protein
MKKLHIIFFFFCFTKIVAQINLVPNPSFEEDTACPNQISQIYKLKYWYSVNATPDYFNKCYNGVSNNAFIPLNSFGYQSVNTPCHSYIGIDPFTNFINSTNSELIGVKLSSPLTTNTKYYLSIMVSLANKCKRACNKLGAKFYLTQPVYTFTLAPTNFADITFTQTVVDTSNWVKLFGSFTSTMNYEYISLGNFYDTLSFTRTYLYNEISPNIYYYLDDVCLSTDSAFAYNYTYDCLTTNIKKNSIDFIGIYPNPAFNMISIESELVIDAVEIVDLNMKPQKLIRNENEIYFELPEGIYFLKFKSSNKIYYKKLIINH